MADLSILPAAEVGPPQHHAATLCAANARLRPARPRKVGSLERKAWASRPVQPGFACSQTSGVDPSRRPPVLLITCRRLVHKTDRHGDDMMPLKYSFDILAAAGLTRNPSGVHR